MTMHYNIPSVIESRGRKVFELINHGFIIERYLFDILLDCPFKVVKICGEVEFVVFLEAGIHLPDQYRGSCQIWMEWSC